MSKWIGNYDFMVQHPWGWFWRRAVVYLGAAAVGGLAFLIYALIVWPPVN